MLLHRTTLDLLLTELITEKNSEYHRCKLKWYSRIPILGDVLISFKLKPFDVAIKEIDYLRNNCLSLTDPDYSE